MGSPARRRIVTGQGGIQLVTALTALALAERGSDAGRAEDYLVIHGLHAPPGRAEPFAAVLRAMAEAVRPWTRVVYLDPDEARALARALGTAGAAPALERVRTLVGVRDADELYVIRDTGAGNALLLGAYPGARRICFGDGIGLYFPEGYFAAGAGATWRTAAWRWLRRQREALGALAGGSARAGVRFDVGYFALPDALGARPPMPTVRVDREALLSTLVAVRDGLDPDVGRRLRARTDGRPVTFLLTSNFSEAGRMAPADEILAYAEFVASLGIPRETVAVVKPHPRDGTGKIAAVRDALAPGFAAVHVLDEGSVGFLPFELCLMDGFLGDDLALAPGVSIVTFSSACLSLGVLFGARSRLGFGEPIVRRRFRAEHVASRLREERDLAMALGGVTETAPPGARRPRAGAGPRAGG